MLNYLGVLNRRAQYPLRMLRAHAGTIVRIPAHSPRTQLNAVAQYGTQVCVCVLTDPGVLNVNQIKMLFLKLIFEILMERQICILAILGAILAFW